MIPLLKRLKPLILHCSAPFLALSLVLVLLTGCEASDPAYVVVNSGDVDANVTNDYIISMPHDLDAVQQGDVYTTFYYEDIPNTSTVNVTLITPSVSDGYVHLRFTCAVENEASLAFYESANVTFNGTALSVFNRNRNVASCAGAAYYGSNVTANGTQILFYKMGSARKAGGDFENLDEMVLLPSTTYLFHIINDTVNANWMVLRLNWYEEGP